LAQKKEERQKIDFQAHVAEAGNDVHVERTASNPPAELRSIIWQALSEK